MTALHRVMSVYTASDAEATKALYSELITRSGKAGELAVNVLRACKKSERAKVYRRGFSRGAYDGKQWAMGEIVRVLSAAPDLVAAWGWAVDPKQSYHNQVLYIDLPAGQVSFHTDQRLAGPSYPGRWDGVAGASAQRACAFAAQLLEGPDCPQCSKRIAMRAPREIITQNQTSVTRKVMEFCSERCGALYQMGCEG